MATATYTRPDGTKVDIFELTEEMVRKDMHADYHNNEAIFQMMWSSIIDERNKAIEINRRLSNGEKIEDITKSKYIK